MIDDENVEDILTNYDFHYNNYAKKQASPEKRLIYAILIYSVIDYLSANRKSYYRNARKWFFNDKDTDYIYSFHNVCFIMNYDPVKFREKLKKLRRTKQKFALDGKRINA